MKTSINVNGMHCEHCVKRVIKAASAIEGVESVEVNLETGKAVITHNNADIKAIIDAINELGFEAAE